MKITRSGCFFYWLLLATTCPMYIVQNLVAKLEKIWHVILIPDIYHKCSKHLHHLLIKHD